MKASRVTGITQPHLRGVARITAAAAEKAGPSAPQDQVSTSSAKQTKQVAKTSTPALSAGSSLLTATATALRTAALTAPGASYLLAPAEQAYRGRLDVETQVKDLKPYAQKRLGDLPKDMSLGQVLAYTGASSMTEVVRNKGEFSEKLDQLKELGRDFQGTVLVRQDDPKASLVVMADPTTPEQTRVSSLADAARNETARADILALFKEPRFKTQLEGSKLAEVKDQLATPGTDVRSTLTQALSELEGGYTAAHSKRAIETIGVPLAEAAGLSADEKAAVKEVSGLYDIGKLAVNQEILDFPGRWPEDKRGSWFGQVSNHVNSELVEPLLKAFNLSDLGRQAVLHHHEKPDGKPYCRDNQAPAWSQLTGAAKVVGLADTIDAMLHSKANHSRPEQRTLEPAEVRRRLENDAKDNRVDGKLVKLAFDQVLNG